MNSSFREMFKKLETIRVPISFDEAGYFDRECPNEGCLFQFKVFGEDWKSLFKDEGVFCPRCGHEAPSKSWWTRMQIDGAREQAIAKIKAAITKSLHMIAEDFNKRQKSGLIRMSMSVKGGPTETVIIPVEALGELEQKLACDDCGARFAVVGAAFFCPCCGLNNVEKMFFGALDRVNASLAHLNSIRKILASKVDVDVAEDTIRSIVEHGLADCVGAFQSFMEVTYTRQPGAKPHPVNAFQRLDFAELSWRELYGFGHSDWIAAKELVDITKLFQKRHLLQHRQGIVDSKYIEKSGDQSYKVGQRIVVSQSEVESLVVSIKKIGGSLIKELQSRAPALHSITSRPEEV